MPALVQASTSAALIGLDALEMSVSLRQNFWKPPPVPEEPTVTRVPALARWNSSATASVIGKTVLDPSMVMTWGAAPPELEVLPCGWPPHAAMLVASEAITVLKR